MLLMLLLTQLEYGLPLHLAHIVLLIPFVLAAPAQSHIASSQNLQSKSAMLQDRVTIPCGFGMYKQLTPYGCWRAMSIRCAMFSSMLHLLPQASSTDRLSKAIWQLNDKKLCYVLLPCCKCLLMDKWDYAAGYWCNCTSRWVYCLLCS